MTKAVQLHTTINPNDFDDFKKLCKTYGISWSIAVKRMMRKAVINRTIPGVRYIKDSAIANNIDLPAWLRSFGDSTSDKQSIHVLAHMARVIFPSTLGTNAYYSKLCRLQFIQLTLAIALDKPYLYKKMHIGTWPYRGGKHGTWPKDTYGMLRIIQQVGNSGLTGMKYHGWIDRSLARAMTGGALDQCIFKINCKLRSMTSATQLCSVITPMMTYGIYQYLNHMHKKIDWSQEPMFDPSNDDIRQIYMKTKMIYETLKKPLS